MHCSSGTKEMMTASFLVRLLLFSSPSINDRYSEVIARIYDEQYATRLLSVPSKYMMFIEHRLDYVGL